MKQINVSMFCDDQLAQIQVINVCDSFVKKILISLVSLVFECKPITELVHVDEFNIM